MKSTAQITAKIKAHALSLGFDFVGISKAGFLEEEAPRLEQWLLQNHHGSMSYMERNFDKRLDPRLLVEGARSVISVLLNYFPDQHQVADAPKISKYAYGNDYHKVLKDKLYLLLQFIKEETGEINGRAFVDSAPVLDRAWAKRSGLGWQGKNTSLIHPRHGSWFFIGELIIDLDLEPDSPIGDYCGTCSKCIDACPTGAIIKPYVVDGSKCISYFTIELKDAIPVSFQSKMDDWMFGCDVCQDVCPWNRFAKPHQEPALQPDSEMLAMNYNDWEEITEEIFNKKYAGSPLSRPAFEGIKRNLKFISKRDEMPPK